jgi:hypothetical protein
LVFEISGRLRLAGLAIELPARLECSADHAAAIVRRAARVIVDRSRARSRIVIVCTDHEQVCLTIQNGEIG